VCALVGGVGVRVRVYDTVIARVLFILYLSTAVKRGRPAGLWRGGDRERGEGVLSYHPDRAANAQRRRLCVILLCTYHQQLFALKLEH